MPAGSAYCSNTATCTKTSGAAAGERCCSGSACSEGVCAYNFCAACNAEADTWLSGGDINVWEQVTSATMCCRICAVDATCSYWCVLPLTACGDCCCCRQCCYSVLR